MYLIEYIHIHPLSLATLQKKNTKNSIFLQKKLEYIHIHPLSLATLRHTLSNMLDYTQGTFFLNFF
jgi:hypothetical protein